MSVWTDHYPHAGAPYNPDNPPPGQHLPWTPKVATPYVGHDHGPVKTLRDDFAMAALTGIMESIGNSNHEVIARDAYAVADAMMKARKGK